MNLTGADLSQANLDSAYLTGSNLSQARLSGASLDNANLSEVDLTGANLKMAKLSNVYLVNAKANGTDFRYATLNDARLFGADLTGIGIDYKSLGEFRFDESTTFGGTSLWEVEADNKAEKANPYLPWSIGLFRCFGRPFTDPNDLRQAELQYIATQRLLRENGYRQLIEMDVREKHALRKRELSERNYRTWLRFAFYRWPLGYGEKILPVISFSMLVIVSFALVFPFVGGMRTTSNQTIPYAFGDVLSLPFNIPYWVEVLWANFYFSMVTFTTLGYGDIQPASTTVQALASLESLIGALLMAFLVFVLGRRATSGMK